MEAIPRISTALLRQIGGSPSVSACPDCAPVIERCGILRGRGAWITQVVPTANVADDPAVAFEIDPAALIAAFRRQRRSGGLEILGYYHTHPIGDAWPSVRDASNAAPDGKLWMIAAGSDILMWRAVANGQVHGRFDPVAFDVMVGKRNTGTVLRGSLP